MHRLFSVLYLSLYIFSVAETIYLCKQLLPSCICDFLFIPHSNQSENNQFEPRLSLCIVSNIQCVQRFNKNEEKHLKNNAGSTTSFLKSTVCLLNTVSYLSEDCMKSGITESKTCGQQSIKADLYERRNTWVLGDSDDVSEKRICLSKIEHGHPLRHSISL